MLEANLPPQYAYGDSPASSFRLATWPDFSTVPLGFNSSALAGIDSLASVDDAAGTPVAQSPRSDGSVVSRVSGVAPAVDPVTWQIRRQSEFDNAIGAGNSTHVQTGVLNNALPQTGPVGLLGDARYTDPGPATAPALPVGTVHPVVGILGTTPYTTILAGAPQSRWSTSTSNSRAER